MSIYKGLRYYKYVYEDWQQPVLTANGTMGGDTFAVGQSSVFSGSYAWTAFKEGGMWHSAEGQNPPQWLSWYNPNPLKIDSIEITVGNSGQSPDLPNDFKIQGSNDNLEWVDVYLGTNTQTSPIPLTMSINLTNNPNRTYKYWRYYVVNVKSRNFGNARNIKITAQEQHVTDGTKDDYDYAVPIKIKDSGRGVFVGSKNTNCLTYTPKHVDVELNPLNVNVTGTWGVIADGVAKGFTTANYIKPFETFNPISEAWEIVIPLTTSSDISTTQTFGHVSATYGMNFNIVSGRFNLVFYQASATGTLSLEPNTKYYVKISWDKTQYQLAYSTDGETYTTDAVISNSTPVGTVSYASFGSNGSNSYFKGSIDLSQSYININGERWWPGDSYTKVGSWIDNGVAGSFTTGNYLKLPEAFSPESNTWEMVAEFTTGSNITSEQGIMGGLGTTNTCTPFYVRGSNWVLHLSSDGTNWNIASALAIMPLAANTKYRCKVEFTGSEYVCSSYNFDSNSWEVKNKIASTALIKGGSTQQIGTNRGTGNPLQGTIDLTQSYIKINDEIWWQGGTGDVTLKAGSKVFVPNGWSNGYKVFNELVIPNDTSAQSFANSEQVVCYNPETNRLCLVGNDVYDTANNVMNDNCSLPVAICTADNTSITSIDEVFDWCGRIGNTAFVLPNVKGFIAKGYNDIGTYNITEFTTNKVLTADLDTVTDRSLLLNTDKLDYVESNYNKVDNLLYNTDGEVINAVECGKVTSDGTAITSLTPYVAQPLTTAISINAICSGADLVYKVGHIFESSTAGTYTFKAPFNCVANVVIVGGGGGGAYMSSGYGPQARAGGSGGKVTGSVALKAGEEYEIVVGSGGYGSNAANESYAGAGGASKAFGNTAGGGGGAYCNVWSGAYVSGGGGGTATVDGFTASNGASGSTASRYGSYGGGGSSGAGRGQNGYVLITTKEI